MKVLLLLLFILFLETTQASTFSKRLNIQQFEEVIDLVTTIYEPIVDQRDAMFYIEGLWEDDVPNAFAHRPRNYVWQVDVHGELARHPLMNHDTFAFVLCHEIGHHMGGAPLDLLNTWASAEGQADYFASSRCLKRIFADKRSNKWSEKHFTAAVVEKCQSLQRGSKEICQRIVQAGVIFGQIMAEYAQIEGPSLSTPSRQVVDNTIVDGYPSLQCRLDTIVQGALCSPELTEQPDDYDESLGYCNKNGQRPSCWYKTL